MGEPSDKILVVVPQHFLCALAGKRDASVSVGCHDPVDRALDQVFEVFLGFCEIFVFLLDLLGFLLDLALELTLMVPVLSDEFTLLKGPLDDHAYLVQIERFENVVLGTASHRINRVVHLRISGHHDNAHVGVELLDGLCQFNPVHSGHFHVYKCDVHRVVMQQTESFFRLARRDTSVTFPAELGLKQFQYCGVVIYYENRARLGHWRKILNSNLRGAPSHKTGAPPSPTYHLLHYIIPYNRPGRQRTMYRP